MSIQISEYKNPSSHQANNFTYDASSNQFIYINSYSLQTAQISQLNPNSFEQNNQIQDESHSSNVGQQTNVIQHSNQAQNNNLQQQQIGQDNQTKENNSQVNPQIYKQNLQMPEEYKKQDENDKNQEQQAEGQKEIVVTDSSSKANQEQKSLSAYLNTLRFSKLKSSQSGISISPSGLTVTCKASQSTHYVLCGTVFPRDGTYYFELIFPNGCEGIDFGLIQMPANLQNPQSLKTHLITYKYKTQKIVGIKVDTKEWTMKVWLNGEFQKLKSKRIAKNDYSFCLKMAMRGVTCILNPFAEDPEKKLSLYSRKLNRKNKLEHKEETENAQKQSSGESQISQLIEQINNQLNTMGQIEQVEETSQQDADENKIEFTCIQKNNNLLVIKDDKMKLLRKNQQGRYPLHFSHFINKPKVLTDIVYFQLYLSEIEALVANQNIFNSIPQQLSESFLSNLNHTLKLFSGCPEDQTVAIRIQFGEIKNIIDQIIEVLSGNISQIYEYIYHPIVQSLPEEKKNDNQTNSDQSNNNQVIVNDGLPFFNENDDDISVQLIEPTTQNDKVTSEEPASTNLKESSSKKHSKDENDLTKDVASQKDPIENLKDIAKNWDVYSLHQILYIVLRLDEQLFAMTIHEDASSEVKQVFNTGVSRIFTSFGRLITFYNHTNTNFSIESLSEAGLINIHDLQTELRHFLDYYTPLQIKKGKQQLDIQNQVHEQTAENRQ